MERCIQIEHPVFQRHLAKPHRVFKRQFADGLFAVFNDSDVGAFVRRLHRAAKGHRATGSRLQAQRHDF